LSQQTGCGRTAGKKVCVGRLNLGRLVKR